MQITIVQAVVISIWIGLVMSRSFLGGATTTLRFTPMMTGLIVGIVFGRVGEAMIITAAIQLIYMGVFSPGGQMPSEPAIAAAIAVAVPVGLLGSYLYQFRFFVNTFVMQKFTDKYAKSANDKMLTVSIILIPILVAFLIFVPFMFVSLYYGAPVIADIVQSTSGSIIFHILEVIGGGLASIGIAVTIYVIGKKNYIAFFLLAYFVAVVLKSLNITMITYAIIGTIIAFIFVLSKTEAVSMFSATGIAAAEDEEEDDY